MKKMMALTGLQRNDLNEFFYWKGFGKYIFVGPPGGYQNYYDSYVKHYKEFFGREV